jgi:hypothetical protein
VGCGSSASTEKRVDVAGMQKSGGGVSIREVVGGVGGEEAVYEVAAEEEVGAKEENTGAAAGADGLGRVWVRTRRASSCRKTARSCRRGFELQGTPCCAESRGTVWSAAACCRCRTAAFWPLSQPLPRHGDSRCPVRARGRCCASQFGRNLVLGARRAGVQRARKPVR